MKGKEGKYLFGICKVGSKGQIVIPKDARNVFNVNPGDSLLLVGDVNQGMALLKPEAFKELTDMLLNKKENN